MQFYLESTPIFHEQEVQLYRRIRQYRQAECEAGQIYIAVLRAQALKRGETNHMSIDIYCV